MLRCLAALALYMILQIRVRNALKYESEPIILAATVAIAAVKGGKDKRICPHHVMSGEIGLVFQDPDDQLLLPVVEDELAFNKENRGFTQKEMQKRIYQTMDFLGITGIKDQHPQRLSGGEKQMVALATVLTLQPSIIVFDESLSTLDEQACSKVLKAM